MVASLVAGGSFAYALIMASPGFFLDSVLKELEKVIKKTDKGGEE